jgi:hypothetical protein
VVVARAGAQPATAVRAIEWKSATAGGAFPFATAPENAFRGSNP